MLPSSVIIISASGGIVVKCLSRFYESASIDLPPNPNQQVGCSSHPGRALLLFLPS
jgi:hypothetical protein